MPNKHSAQVSECRRRRKLRDPEYARREHLRMLHARTPASHRAHEAVRAAVKNGRLVRPDECEQCNVKGYIEAAHQDYSTPLDVRWLCRSCHRQWDTDDPKGGYDPTGFPLIGVRATRKLTDEQVEDIRRRYNGSYGSTTRLAKEFGIHPQYAHKIVHGYVRVRHDG